MILVCRKWNYLESVLCDSYAAAVKMFFNIICAVCSGVLLGSCGERVEAIHITEKREFLPKFDQEKFEMEVPKDWRRAPDNIPGKRNRNRLLSYQFGTQGGEIYLSYGLRGGVYDNVNRWLGQFGKEPVQSMDVLEEIEVAGEGKFYLVEAYGTFSVSRMGGDGVSRKVNQKEDWGMLGVYGTNQIFGGFSVKMTGPAEEIKANKKAFILACKTIAVVEGDENGEN